MKKTIRVFCGQSISDKCRGQKHPVQEVKDAKDIMEAAVNNPGLFHLEVYSNHPDFVSAMKYIGIKHGIQVEFFLDGVSHGNDIEPIFADFNKALDMINELGATEM